MGIRCKRDFRGCFIPRNPIGPSKSLAFCCKPVSLIFVLEVHLCYTFSRHNYFVFSPHYSGMNSIVVYLCHEIFARYFPIQFKVASTHASQLAMDIWGTAIWVTLAYVMYRKKKFVAI